MMYGLRPAPLSIRISLIIVVLGTLVVFSAMAAAAFETEVVGPDLMRVAAARGGIQLVPDLGVSGQIMAQVAPGVSAEQLQARLVANNCTLEKHIPNTSLVVIGLPRGMSVNDGVAMWSREAVIARAEPDRVAYPTAIPNDPLYQQQWHWPLIGAEYAWDVQQGSEAIIVAVVDSGFDPNHEDLVDRYWVNVAERDGTADVDDDGNGFVDDIFGWDFWANNNDPDARPQPGEAYDPESVSHGVHVAGIIGAATNNQLGVAGHDWAARLMMIRVFGPGDEGSPTSVCMAGVQYAIDNGARIINCSFMSRFTEMWDEIVANAYNSGVIIVAGAGNEDHAFTEDPRTWRSPVCNDGPLLGVDNYVIGVAATDRNDTAASFTNRDESGNRFVDVSAPGVDILSTLYHDPEIPGLQRRYGTMSGTSMAAPVVSGLAALILAQYPGYRPADVIRRITDTADDISAQNPLTWQSLGAGRVNSAAALGVRIPPDPVSNLVARSTPNSQGGSITITWRLSPQDNDILEYRLLRATETTPGSHLRGEFTLLATLEPGTNFYVDTPVPDLEHYWYQVLTVDEHHVVPSSIAGPTWAIDDLPPPPVETLVAVDTPADAGGSISLNWRGYQPPEDLVEYRIYRSTSGFSDVSEMEPIATRPGDLPMNYIDSRTEDHEVLDGVEYWYAVTGIDDWGNEDTSVTAFGPVIANPNFAFNYPAGLSLIAVGATPSSAGATSIADLLKLTPGGPANLAHWDPTVGNGEYVLWSNSPNSPGFNQQLGRAWWLRADSPMLVTVSGQPAADGGFSRAVTPGWNMIGNPFPSTMNFADTEVTGIGQGTPVSLATSNELGYTRDYGWAYDTISNSYRLITGVNLPFADRELRRGRGMLMLARRPATLVLHRSVAPAADAEDNSLALDGWSLQIVAEAGGVADTDNFIGVSSNAAAFSGIVSPPRPDADLDLFFVRPWADGARLATDFVEPGAEKEWTIRVAAALPGATVRLSWPDLTTLPNDCRPILVDEQTGKVIYLRTSTGYSYEVGEQPTERSFTLRLADTGAEALAINTFSAAAAEGGAQIVYSLSAPAAVDLEVLNIAGVTVRRVIEAREQAAGSQQILWDGRNQSGSPVPAGTYIVRITARSESGQRVSAIRSLQLNR
jgi:thermitase